MPSTTCGWCGRVANMTFVKSSATFVEFDWTPGRTGDDYQFFGSFRCDHCRCQLIGYARVSDAIMRDPIPWLEKNPTLGWIPEKGQQPPTFASVPEHIAEAAQEAFRARSIGCNRAAVLMARAVIEATAKNQGISSGNLAEKINAMAERQLIREYIKEAAHEIRFLGNDMAHGDFVEPIDDADADLILSLIELVLNEVFEGPALVAKRRNERLEKSRPKQS